MPKYFSTLPYLLVCLLSLSPASSQKAYAQHPNVLLGTQSSPNEPSIAIDPTQPQYLIAASNINNYYLSSDTGATWTHYYQNSAYGVWGDPILIADTTGSFYYFHLANPPNGNWIDRMVCQRSDDHGLSWPIDSYAGLNGTKVQDKEGVVVNPFNNHIYLCWTQFDAYNSTNPQDSSIILFSKSEDRGVNWSTPVRLSEVAGDCLDDDNTVEGAVPAVGPNGEIYVAWAGPEGIVFDRSTDEGETWLEHDIHVSDIVGGWAMDIEGIYRANGMPITLCDLSGGPHHGTIYICWADQRNGPTDTDIWLVKSTDQGNTWSEPLRINDDTAGKQQFFPWMAIDQTTGYLYCVFYDRRQYDDTQTDVYMAFSADGGESFTNFRISESPFTPTAGTFFGDYNYIAAHNNIIRPIWTRLDQTSLSVWTALINTAAIPNFPTRTTETWHAEQKPARLLGNFPNPADKYTYVSFELEKTAKIKLLISNAQGQTLLTPISNKRYRKGEHSKKIKIDSLPAGVYYYLLYANGKLADQKKMLVE